MYVFDMPNDRFFNDLRFSVRCRNVFHCVIFHNMLSRVFFDCMMLDCVLDSMMFNRMLDDRRVNHSRRVFNNSVLDDRCMMYDGRRVSGMPAMMTEPTVVYDRSSLHSATA